MGGAKSWSLDSPLPNYAHHKRAAHTQENHTNLSPLASFSQRPVIPKTALLGLVLWQNPTVATGPSGILRLSELDSLVTQDIASSTLWAGTQTMWAMSLAKRNSAIESKKLWILDLSTLRPMHWKANQHLCKKLKLCSNIFQKSYSGFMSVKLNGWNIFFSRVATNK